MRARRRLARDSAGSARGAIGRARYPPSPMSPFWIWTQALIVVFVLAGIVIAIVKLV